ncbi:MAG: mycofactocin biosynthesis peptidyl-dipeptidase MftE [Ilumatobacteraceae bacterium]
MRLEDLTWPDVEAQPPVLVIPVGSCEQHGPHLPLGTDTMIAEALAGRLVARRPANALAPPLTVTASGEHAGFPGTLSVGTAVVEAMVVELVRSADWSGGVVLVNGHGGNRAPVDAAVATLRAEGRDVLAWWPALDDADAHAGRTETSIVLELRPDLVRRDRAVAGETAPLQQLMGRMRAGGVATVSRTGVLGDPTGATSAEGRAILDALTDDLVSSFDRWTASR